MVDKSSKLMPQYLGPYEVVTSAKADVQCKHLVTGAIATYHMDKLKPCFSNSEDAYEAAMVDYNQYVVKEILSYTGDPELRTTMQFMVEFEDGSVVTLPYSLDLSTTMQFEKFCRQERPLLPLLYTVAVWKRIRKESYAQVIGVVPGDTCYVDLRAWGSSYFQSLMLPMTKLQYVVVCVYLRWEGKSKRRIVLECPLFQNAFAWDSFSVYAYGSQLLLTDKMILVDARLCEEYPGILIA